MNARSRRSRSWGRSVAVSGLALGLIGVLIATAGPASGRTAAGRAASGGSLVFNTWGGAYQAAQQKAIVPEFEKATGINVTVTNPIDYAKLRAMVQAHNVVWDVADVEPFVSIQYCKKGWLQKLDFKQIDRSRFVPQMKTTPCSVPNGAFDLAISYRSDKWPKGGPQTWKDFFDTKKFPGKRAFPNYAQSGVLEAALLADGVPKSKLYPIDYQRAFKKLDSIKNDIVWWTSGDQSEQLMKSGEVTMCACWVTRMYDAHTQGAKIKLSWKQSLLGWDDFVIPKGAKNLQNAMKFVNFGTLPKQEVAMTKYVPWGPSTKQAAAHPAPASRAWIPTTPEHIKQAVTFDYPWWAAHADEMNQKFQQWLLK